MRNKLNAVKHGLLSKEVILSSDDKRPFNKLVKRLVSELQPETALEILLTEQIIVNYWRLRRFLILENEVLLFAGRPKMAMDNRDFIDLFTSFVSQNPSFDLLSRYNSSLSKSFYKAIHEYRDLKRAQKPSINQGSL